MTPQSCARPACPSRAAAWLAYDYEARCAWLDDQPLPPEDNSHRWPLCERHADNLRVPRGWFCVDQRTTRGGGRQDGQEAMLLPGSGASVVVATESVPVEEGAGGPGEARDASPPPGARRGRGRARVAEAQTVQAEPTQGADAEARVVEAMRTEVAGTARLRASDGRARTSGRGMGGARRGTGSAGDGPESTAGSASQVRRSSAGPDDRLSAIL